jgi:hypothetical protein
MNFVIVFMYLFSFIILISIFQTQVPKNLPELENPDSGPRHLSESGTCYEGKAIRHDEKVCSRLFEIACVPGAPQSHCLLNRKRACS